MQGLAILASMPQVPAGAAQAAGGASDAVALEDVGFASLLAAQIKAGMVSVDGDLTVEDSLDAARLDLKADDSVVSIAVDPMLSGLGFVPLLPPQAGGTQQLSPEQDVSGAVISDVAGNTVLQASSVAPELVASGLQQTIATEELVLPLGRMPVDRKGDVAGPVVEGAVDRELDPSLPAMNASGREKVAEFAVGGKVLPLDAENKGVDSRVVLPVGADMPRQPDSVAGSLSAAMTPVQSASLSEFKAVAVQTVQVPVGAAGWGEALGQKVVWMAGQQQQVAELHLNPPNLGPMEVRLTVSNDQVSALFVSAQPAVREAIEAAMPRLREMFADSGMMLGNAMVSSDSLPRQQNTQQDGYSPKSGFSLAPDPSTAGVTSGSLPLRDDGRGMVDFFA